MTITGYIYAAMLAIIMCMSLALWFEGYEVKTLQTQNAAYEVVNQAQKNDLKLCSDNTAALKTADDKITTDAVAAVVQAKKDAQVDYVLAQSITGRKPITPIVTKQNQAQYDNGDAKAQIQDLLQSTELMNYYIEQNQVNQVKK